MPTDDDGYELPQPSSRDKPPDNTRKVEPLDRTALEGGIAVPLDSHIRRRGHR